MLFNLIITVFSMEQRYYALSLFVLKRGTVPISFQAFFSESMAVTVWTSPLLLNTQPPIPEMLPQIDNGVQLYPQVESIVVIEKRKRNYLQELIRYFNPQHYSQEISQIRLFSILQQKQILNIEKLQIYKYFSKYFTVQGGDYIACEYVLYPFDAQTKNKRKKEEAEGEGETKVEAKEAKEGDEKGEGREEGKREEQMHRHSAYMVKVGELSYEQALQMIRIATNQRKRLLQATTHQQQVWVRELSLEKIR